MATGTRSIRAVESARQRRAGRALEKQVRIEWLLEEVLPKIHLPMRKRVRLATELLKNRVIRNISRPVTKTRMKRKRDTTVRKTGGKKGSSYTKVTNRSKPGEYFKAETTQSMKSVFSGLETLSEGSYMGYVGTPLDYDVILETRMNRKFLAASLDESADDIRRILQEPIK